MLRAVRPLSGKSKKGEADGFLLAGEERRADFEPRGSKHTGRPKLISNRLSRRSIERRMGTSEASRTGLCNVIGLSSVDTFNRRYETPPSSQLSERR
jgi:hypothetical protein